LIVGSVNAQKVSFPGNKSEAKSPNGRFAVRNSDDQKLQPPHTLTLINARTGTHTTILTYGRHVDVLWSPESQAFVVNDYEESDRAHPILFSTPWTNHPVDMREMLIDFLKTQEMAKSIENNQHVYFVAQRWLSGSEILCELTGYGDANPKAFTAHYVYKIGAGFRILEKRNR
jgi:hypothetical protein